MADNPEKKVVVLSPAGSKVKASDVTREAPVSETQITDPMQSRESETATFKKLGVAEPSAAADGNKGKRTIKLKPLRPAGATAAEKAVTAPPIPPAMFKTTGQSLGNIEDETVKIDKARHVKSPEAPLQMGIPGTKQTIKLRPSSTTVPPPSAESVPESVKPATSSTLKLKPPTSVEDASFSEEEETIAMQRQQVVKLSPRPATVPPPPSASTVKLAEGQTQGGEDDATVGMQRRTVKLVAKPAGGTSPSSPTVRLAPEETEQGIQAPKVHEATPAEGTPVAAVSRASQSSAPSGAGAVKKTLKLVRPGVPSTSTSQHLAVPAVAKPQVEEGTSAEQPKVETHEEAPVAAQGKLSDEPSIIFTIAACAAMLTLVYFGWMVVGQFGEKFLGWDNFNVPGASGKVK